tara:strand:- start:6 stop:272 length:267 start_codon:yes stop_codon:yes gene_type:complete
MNEFNKKKERLIMGYNLYIEDYESDITFEEFLILRILNQEDEIDALMKELIKYNPPYLEEVDEAVEEILDTLKKQDKEAEEKFKEEYQ